MAAHGENMMANRRAGVPANETRSAEAVGQRLDLDRYFPWLVTAITNKWSRSANTLYRKHFGVTVAEWRIVVLLALEPDISAARICQVIGYDKAPVSRMLKAMERRGLVRILVDPFHARKHVIALTPAGLALHDRVVVIALERERKLLSCLAPDEKEQLLGLLRRVHGNLGVLAGAGTAL